MLWLQFGTGASQALDFAPGWSFPSMSQLASGAGPWASDQGRLMDSLCCCCAPNWLLGPLVTRGVQGEVSGFVVCL